MTAQTPVHAQPTDPVVDRIQKTGVLRIGYNPSNKPFSFPGPDGTAIGYTIDLCKIVVDKLGPQLGLADGLKAEYIEIKSSDRIPMLTKGELDLECSASTNTLERQKSVGFSLTFFTAAGRMLVNKNTGAKTYRDLTAKHRVVVVKGTTGQATLGPRLAALGRSPTMIEVGSQTEAEAMLDEGKAEGYVTDDVLLYAVKGKLKNPEQWEVIGKNLSIEPYGMMMPKGAKQFESMVDAVLRDLYSSGAINGIYNKWFQTKDFNMPITMLTREAFKWPTKQGADKPF